MFDVELWVVCVCMRFSVLCIFLLGVDGVGGKCGRKSKVSILIVFMITCLVMPWLRKLKIHTPCCYEYNVTTDILWPFYFPSRMIYYINFMCFIMSLFPFFCHLPHKSISKQQNFLCCSTAWLMSGSKSRLRMKKKTIFLRNIHACLCVHTTIHSFHDKVDDTKDKNAIACIMDHYDTFMTALYTITLYIRYTQTLSLSSSLHSQYEREILKFIGFIKLSSRKCCCCCRIHEDDYYDGICQCDAEYDEEPKRRTSEKFWEVFGWFFHFLNKI